MSDESVELEIELKDGVSKPAKRMSAALQKIGEDAQRSQTRMMAKINRASIQSNKRRLNTEFRAAKQSDLLGKRSAQIREAEGAGWLKLGGGISNVVGGIGVAVGALGAMAAVSAGVVYGAAKLGGALIDSAKSAGDLRFALGQLTHTDGRKELEEITRTGVALGLGAEDAAHSYANLLKQGFSPPDAKKWIRFGADMQSLGSTADEVNGLLVQMSQMKGKGKVEQSDLRVMADNGLNLGYVREALAEKLGKSVPEIMKMQEAGQITADMGFEAIEKAILRKMNTSRAGEAAEKYVQSFSGSFKRGEAEMGRVGLGLGAAFERGFTERVEGAKELKGFGLSGMMTEAGMGGFLDKMANSPTIAKLGVFVEKLGNGFALMLPQILAVGEAFVDGFAGGAWLDTFSSEDKMIGFTAFLRDDLVPAVKAVGKVAGWVSSAILAMTYGFAWAGTQLTNLFVTPFVNAAESLVTNFSELGPRVIEGFIMGFTGGIPGALSAVAGWALRTVGAAREGLKVRSPSKEFAEIGKYSAMGFQVGLDSMTPQLPSADAMVPNSLGGGGSSNSFSVVINVDGSKDPGETARMVRIEFESLLAGSFGRFAEGIA
jgi:tape measure domain-containing protein